MSIYIEYVIIDNLVINFLILLCVKKTLKLKSKWYRILLSSILGTIFAVILPLINLPPLATFPFKILLGLLMVLTAAKYVKLKDYVVAFLCFIMYTLLLGGACMATLLAFGTDLDLLSQGGYDIVLPLGVIFLIVSLYIYFIMLLAKYLTRKREIEPYLRQVTLYLGSKVLNLKAFIDSGNRLVDNKSGMPVIILSISALKKCFSQEDIECLMIDNGRHSTCFKGVHKTEYNTISGEAKQMILFEADKLVIKQSESEYTTNRFIVGVANKNFSDASSYDLLLNPAVL